MMSLAWVILSLSKLLCSSEDFWWKQTKEIISEIVFLFIEENNSAACSDGRVFWVVAIVKVLGTFYKHG